MPQAVTHLLLPLIAMAIIREIYIRKRGKRNFPLHYVLIAGIAGLLPDLDIAAYWVLYFFRFSLGEVHRTFSHTIFVPIAFALIALILIIVKDVEWNLRGKYKLKLSMIFLMIAFGSLFHLVIDGLLIGQIAPLYPLFVGKVGLDLVNLFPSPLNDLILPSFDAAILALWLIYLEWKHKISDFV